MRKIQEAMQPYGHVFATFAQESKLVKNFYYEPELTTDKVIYSPPRKWTPTELPILLQWITDSLETGFIEESCSPYNVAIVMVDKPNGGKRFTFNLISLNKVLKNVVYPITSLEQITEQLYSMKFLTSMDVQAAYNTLSIHPAKRHLFSLQTPYGSYQCCSLPMGAQVSSEV